MSHILILYSTTDGHTRVICDRIKAVLEGSGHQVTAANVAEGRPPHPGDFDKVLIGASIRYGRHSPLIRDYILKYHTPLDGRPNAFFSVNLVARKADKNRPDTNPYCRRFLRRLPWKPQVAAVFAGRLDYPAYAPLDRWLIRMIMRITGGPTDPQTVVEFTDWQAVDEFARVLASM